MTSKRNQKNVPQIPILATLAVLVLFFLTMSQRLYLDATPMFWFGILLVVGFFVAREKLVKYARAEGFLVSYWTAMIIVLLITAYLLSWVLWVGLIGLMLMILFVGGMGEGTAEDDLHRRGTRINSPVQAAKSLEAQRDETDRGIFWGGITIPSRFATTHFAVIGATGSGKTITLRLFMQSILPTIQRGSGKRAMLFDPKREWFPILSGMNLRCDIITLNPFDDRCYAWDVATDISDPEDAAGAFADILVPSERNANTPFFRDAVATLLHGMVAWFIYNAPGRWTLRDVVLAMRSEAWIKAILSSDLRTEHFLEVLGSGDTAANIRGTLTTKMRPYWVVAACWHKAQRKISLRQWLRSESILLLGQSNTSETAIRAVNQIIFKRMAQLLLDRQETRHADSYIIFDELPTAGKLEMLKRLANEGRSKGVSLALGFQDIEDLRQAYTKEEANTILGQCDTKAILRLRSPETAQWASDLFGKREHLKQSYTRNTEANWTHPSQTSSTTWSLGIDEAVLPGEFMSIPITGREHGLEGIYQVGNHNYRNRLSWDGIESALNPARNSVAGFVPIPEHYKQLELWTQNDLERLGLSGMISLNYGNRISLPPQGQSFSDLFEP